MSGSSPPPSGTAASSASRRSSLARYEVYAASRSEADWQRFQLYQGSGPLRLTLAPFPELRLSIEDTEGKPVDPLSAPILIRRRDLTGEGKPEPFRGEARVLAPGSWELSLAPTPSWYSVTPSGWTEVALTAPGPAVAKFVLSNRPATVRGVVRDASGEPVAGAPSNSTGSARSAPTLAANSSSMDSRPALTG